MNYFDLPTNLHTKPIVPPEGVFVAEGAKLLGDVRLQKRSSVWYNCVLRGDINFIELGEGSNIQDGSVLHVENKTPCIIGKNVVVGHMACVHACTIEDGAMIGMKACILSGAYVETGAMVAAGAVVKEKQIVRSGKLYAGVPAREIRDLSEEEIQNIERLAQKYQHLAQAFLNGSDKNH